MKEGMILNKWNYIEDGVVVAQCYAKSKGAAVNYFEDYFQDLINVSDVVMDPAFNTKEK